MKRSEELQQSAASIVVALMTAAARTAPKTRGIDNIDMIAVDDEAARSGIIAKMKEISKRDGRPGFERDAVSIAAAPAILIIGVKSAPAGLDCGFCGYKTCEELKKSPGICSYNSVDLGIAASSAAAAAAHSHVDNRIMYSIGKAALELGIFASDIRQALGIPLSVTGKSPYFDRK